MATASHSDTKTPTDAAPKALLLGLVLVPTRLIPLLQAMLDLLRLLLRVLHVIIPPEVGLIKMRVIGGSKHEQFVRTGRCVRHSVRIENDILAVNACSVLIIAVLVYLTRSLVAFSPCSACCQIDDLCLAIFALPFLMLHVTACFACFA